MISVSAAFSASEIADIAQVAAAVYIFRGNYASSSAFGATASASGSDGSGNYPPAGAIDGDRTEINMGAVSAADNGVGLSTWKADANPSGGSPNVLTIAFNATRTFNYVKVYNYSGDPLTTYVLQYWNGSAWVTFAGSAYSGYTGGLDVYDFSGAGTTYTSTQIRASVSATTSGGPAQIVEVEVYYKVDVTSRVLSVKPDRQRDWKQVTPLAAACALVFDNSDRFFSLSYTPTTAETAAGYFNSELNVGLKVQVQLGFVNEWYPGTGYGGGGFGGGTFGGPASGQASEYVNSFMGTIDSLRAGALKGTCAVDARDGMKAVLNTTWSSKLKYNIDLGTAAQYLLNICNVSNYEMSVDTTGLSVPYFFTPNSSMFTEIQKLVEAAGNAQFWFDENGTATFANLLASAASSNTAFTWTPITLASFTQTFNSGGSITNTGAALVVTSSGAASIITASAATAELYGWEFTLTTSGTGGGVVMFAGVDSGSGGATVRGYGIETVGGSGAGFYFNRFDGNIAAPVNLGFFSTGTISGTFTVLRDASGNFYIYRNSVLIFGLITDATYTSFGHFNVVSSGTAYTMNVSNINTLNSTLTASFAAGVLTVSSATIDQGSTVSAEGNLAVGFAPSNAPITYQTRTSADDITYGAWTSVTLSATTQQGAIPSTTNRYIQYRYSFGVGAGVPLWAAYYVTVNWTLTSAAASVRSISYDAELCDVEEELSDSLGGDSSILNYISVAAAPLLLTGTTSDVQWQATTGLPAANVSATNPLVVYTGTVYIQAIVASGMDISLMAGTNPAAVAITWGTATGSVAISYVHPTKPIIALTVTGQGTITNLQLIGQAFSASTTPINVLVQDAASQAQYGLRPTSVSNPYIANPAIAQLIANTQLTIRKAPARVLTGVEICLAPSLQLTDQLQMSEPNLGLSAARTWNTSGVGHELSMNGGAVGAVKTMLKAVYLPT